MENILLFITAANDMATLFIFQRGNLNGRLRKVKYVSKWELLNSSNWEINKRIVFEKFY